MRLVPHINMPLMQQKFLTQSEALEIAMKLQASPVSETGVGMNQIQSQLANMTIQLQDIKKGKEIHEELWCTRCHMKGHHKDQCSDFCDYLLLGAPNPLSHGGIPWCRICQTRGQQHKECLYLKKVVSNPANLFCNFCHTVGHEEKDCRVYDMLQERTMDISYMKGGEHRSAKSPLQQNPPQFAQQ